MNRYTTVMTVERRRELWRGKEKGKKYERKRKRYTFTLSDKAHESLRNRVPNAPQFIEELIKRAETRFSPRL
jgi:hypothetical protein